VSDETFTSDWLALREPVDHRSRDADLVASLAKWWRSFPSYRVLDLGSGTGSNLRYLAPRLGEQQEWTLVDRDGALLDRARPFQSPGWPESNACSVSWTRKA
jgi:SAM-dependent methyltransferase